MPYFRSPCCVHLNLRSSCPGGELRSHESFGEPNRRQERGKNRLTCDIPCHKVSFLPHLHTLAHMITDICYVICSTTHTHTPDQACFRVYAHHAHTFWFFDSSYTFLRAPLRVYSCHILKSYWTDDALDYLACNERDHSGSSIS